jgi:alpha-1,2-mannosyltransferase
MRRWAAVTAWTALAAGSAYDVTLALQRPDRFPDLDVYRAAAGTLADGGDLLYDVIGINGGPFTYPPVAAVLLWPARLPPILVAGVLLALLNVLCALLAARLCLRRSATWAAPALVAVAMWTVPFRTTVFFGQIGAVLMLLVAADLLLDTPPWPLSPSAASPATRVWSRWCRRVPPRR